MKFYVVLLLLFVTKLNAQAPHDIQFYLDNSQVSKKAKDFYNGKFMAADDARTFAIIDSLHTKNNLTRPFYILLVSAMIDKADGTLSESLGISCKSFIESNPNALLDFLYSKNKIVEEQFLINWAKQIAGELMIDCEKNIAECLNNSSQKASSKITTDNRTRLDDFYEKIKNYCH